MSKTCVVISPYFPPSMLAGVHRARHLAKHLPAAGWTPIVLCVNEAFHEERLDPDLARLVPAETEVIKVPALPARITRPFGLGEISLRAMAPMRRALIRLLAARPVDAVLMTGSPYYPMLLAGEVRRRFGVPVVLDFQDPWVSGWGAKQGGLSKARVSHALALLLEPRAVRWASHVTSVSDVQNAQMVQRYGWLPRERMTAIPIGCDPEDISAARNMSDGGAGRRSGPGQIDLCYVGTCMPRFVPVLEVLFRAVARLRGEHPDVVERLRLRFIGTSSQPNDFEGYRVRPIAGTVGVAHLVDEMPQRIPYLSALRALARADGLLLIGSDEPHYTASKIYPALMSDRPFLSVFHRASSSHEILSAAGGGVAYAFSDLQELNALEGPISDGLFRLATDPAGLGQAAAAVCQRYHAKSIARRFADVFDQLVAERSARGRCA